jgi:hypothetical protein
MAPPQKQNVTVSLDVQTIQKPISFSQKIEPHSKKHPLFCRLSAFEKNGVS